jgi:signal transduction histidine kinase/ActR/RegA family two-component response regulator
VTAHEHDSLERRLLFLAPTGRDAAMATEILRRAGIECVCCHDVQEVCRELASGAGAVMLPEEGVLTEEHRCLTRWLENQLSWSDLPILILARRGADSATVAQAMDRLGNVTVIERPTRVAALVSAARTALRARQRQYEIREQLSALMRNDEALRDADRRKNEFLAILAHELRNPLAPIRNSLHVLKRKNPQDATTRRATEMMERQVNYMVRLVDDLLEVSRISIGKIELRKQPVEVSAIVRDALETSRPLVEAAGHYLRLEFPPEPLVVEGDEVRLTQVVANLLNNAVKYSERGGRIWLGVRRDRDAAVVYVRDLGRGIPPDKLPRVFDLFMQVDQDPRESHGGLGIGLTLVKRLVEMHGGTVEARSEGLGKGSEFVVRLPLSAGLPVPAAPSGADSQPLQFPRRVLVVDDNRDAADSLRMLLELLGAEVVVAYNGADAFDALAAHRPAVVLLDIGMPGMDGFEVARRIRRDPRYRDVTLIALTGWGQDDIRDRARAQGFDHHLTKPADPEFLQDLLSSIESRAAREADA